MVKIYEDLFAVSWYVFTCGPRKIRAYIRIDASPLMIKLMAIKNASRIWFSSM